MSGVGEAAAILGIVSFCIDRLVALGKAIDLITGCYTGNTPVAREWRDTLYDLRSEIMFAEGQLCSAKDMVERRRESAVALDELIQELALQVQASENTFLTAIDKFKDQGVFDWALLEASGSKTSSALAPMKGHCKELQRIRCQLRIVQERISDAVILSSHGSTGGQFPTLESLANIQDDLANKFLQSDPFCKVFEAKEASGLLVCNRDGLTLDALQNRIQQTGVHWVQETRRNRHNEKCRVDGDTASTCYRDHSCRVGVIEECRDKILVQLKGLFKEITEKRGGPFTSHDYHTATCGKYALDEWTSICLAASDGIVIAVGGKMSAGKSSIINAMLGQPLLPTASKCTKPFWCNS